jgi:hypothetical protein
MSDGTLFGCGYNYYSQLGIEGVITYSSVPILTQMTTTNTIKLLNNTIKNPMLFNIDISLISTLGDQVITISGINFDNNSIVKIDGSFVDSTLVSSRQITFVSPANTSGSKYVTVSNNFGTSNPYQIIYVNPPSISYLDISLVLIFGGETITINGSNFNYNPILRIDGSLVASTLVSSTQITFVTPIPNSYGYKSVTITNDIGTSNSVLLQYITKPISNICFPAGTPVQCDQGLIPIEKINTDICTIRGNKIEIITKTVTQDKYLVCIEKDAFSKNIPSQKTLISKNHALLYGKKVVKAKNLLELNNEKIYKEKYNGSLLYNVLLENKHDVMIVNNLVCETLDPNSGIAKMYLDIKKFNYTTEQKNKLYKEYNNYIIQNKIFSK